MEFQGWGRAVHCDGVSVMLWLSRLPNTRKGLSPKPGRNIAASFSQLPLLSSMALLLLSLACPWNNPNPRTLEGGDISGESTLASAWGSEMNQASHLLEACGLASSALGGWPTEAGCSCWPPLRDLPKEEVRQKWGKRGKSS